MKNVLILLGDCPGMYVPVMNAIGRALKKKGCQVFFADLTGYYQEFRGVNCEEVGPVFYFDEFLGAGVDENKLNDYSFDFWSVYPTFVRQHFFFGKHLNQWSDYKKVSLFFNQIFDRHQFDLVICEPPSNAFFYIAHNVAKERGVPYAGFMSARVPGYINVFLDAYGEQLLENVSKPITEGDVSAGPPSYMAPREARILNGTGFNQARTFVKFLSRRSLETGATPYLQLRALYINKIWRKLRYLKARYKRVFQQDIQFDEERLTVLHPLHFRPEASTSVLAPTFEDDLEFIKNIAFTLPQNVTLVVKEHSAAVGIRGHKFYKKLLSFPNVVLLGPEYDLAGNLGKFDCVLTLTSTVGYEAARLGIPVLLFGRVFYSEYPGVNTIRSFEEVKEALSKISGARLEHQKSVIDALYLPYCFKGRFDYMSDVVVSKYNIKCLLVPLLQLLELEHDTES